MFLLKLNKWTLSFETKEFENEYDEYQKPFQYKFNQLLLGIGMFVSLICLITFISQEETTFIIAQMGGTSALIFFELIITRKMFPFIKYIYAFNYVCIFIFVCYYLKYEENSVPLFLSGHSYCLVLLCALHLCDKIFRVLYILLTPIIMLVLSKNVNLENIYNIGQLIHGTLGIGMLFYWIEYTQRQAFTFHKQIEKTKELLDEYTYHGLFAISLNERTQQFQLEYHNKIISQMFQFVFDTNIMKEFIRNSYIVETQINIEDYLFKRMKNKQIEDVNFSFNQQLYTGTIKIFDFDKKYLFIAIRSNEIYEQYQEQIKSLKDLILAQSFQIQKITIVFQKRFQLLQKEQIPRTQFLYLKCMNLKLRNLLNNNFVYFQLEKNINLNHYLINFKFTEYLHQIHHYFVTQCKANHRIFRLKNEIKDELQVHINVSILTQILINVFELLKSTSKRNGMIILRISLIENPREEEQKMTNILQFSWTLEQKSENIHINQLAETVTNYLLKRIGPCNKVHASQQDNYVKYNFYVYANQNDYEPAFGQ